MAGRRNEAVRHCARGGRGGNGSKPRRSRSKRRPRADGVVAVLVGELDVRQNVWRQARVHPLRRRRRLIDGDNAILIRVQLPEDLVLRLRLTLFRWLSLPFFRPLPRRDRWGDVGHGYG